MQAALRPAAVQAARPPSSRRTGRPLRALFIAILLWAAMASLGHAAPEATAGNRRQASRLLSTLRDYEVVSVSSPALRRMHPFSIAPGGQKARVRTFAQQLTLSFHSTRIAPRTMTATSSPDSARSSRIELQLSRMDDLFHPQYSETQQVWRDGKRFVQEESVKPLSEVEQCYYRAANPTSSHYLSLSACNGGFSGFVHREGKVLLMEPARKHLQKGELRMHLQAMRQRRNTGLNDTEEEEDEELHSANLHILFSPEDVQGPEAICTVGLTEDEKNEYLRTGRLSARTLSHGHSHAHSHEHAEHAAERRTKARSLTAGFGSEAYDSWLAAMDEHSAERQAVDQAIAAAEAEESSAEFNSTSSRSNPLRRRLLQQTIPLKYVELLVVNDRERFLLEGGDTQDSSARIVAHVKAVYEATTAFRPHITVVLIGQITWIEQNPFTLRRGQCSACRDNNGVSVDELLRAWNSWRSNYANVAPYAHDNGHLFSGLPFERPTLGYAGVSAMCSNSISGGVETMQDQSRDEFYHAMVVAHEMGHNFGMNHDSSDNECPQSGYIMNAVLSAPPEEFSSCSINYLNSWAARTYPTCMDNVPTAVYGDAICGNGFVEQGEQCDCGNNVNCQIQGSRDPCCNATSCQFMPGAQCSATSGCCQNCQVVPAEHNRVCRPAINSCDLPEMCPGPSENDSGAECPPDVGYAPGTQCNAGQYGPGLCYLNQCFSYLQQCRTAGANFPGAPFDTCIQQRELNQGQYCGTLWCSSVPGQCTFFRQSGNIVRISDGMPCPDSRDNLAWQCKDGRCVNPEQLNTNYAWQESGWETCTDCTAQQYQNVSCLNLLTNQTVTNALCSPTNMPRTQRLCYNPERECWGEQEEDSDVVNLFGYIKLSRRTLIFSTLGLCTGFLVILACCYQAVTFTSEDEQLPGPSDEQKAAAAEKKARAEQMQAEQQQQHGTGSKKKKKKHKTVSPEF